MAATEVNRCGHDECANVQDGSVLIRIPAGEFSMGSSDRDIEEILLRCPGNSPESFAAERPRRTVFVEEFFIGRHQITNQQFSRFICESGYSAEGAWHRRAGPGRERHPVVGVTFSDAVAYSRWAGLRLPSEAEWEKAARGTGGRHYPWGDTWDRNLCNNLTVDRGDLVGCRSVDLDCQTIPVGMIPEGASWCGALDMAGNVWEWCDLPCLAQPDSRRDVGCFAEEPRFVRGGSWHGDSPIPFRCAARLARPSSDSSPYTGFRCAWSAAETRSR
ncbi:MAG: formylglycine-generating enzyme family protein [Candidatus Riflebacteria bacterium]|nr:formylglycine-generating enzyme family protein [Candidatus Riflebacteria bacterium]